MPELNFERLQAASRAQFGVDAQAGLQLATGIKDDMAGIIRKIYGGDWQSSMLGSDTLYELLEEGTVFGGPAHPFSTGELTRRIMTAEGGAATTPTIDAQGRLSFAITTAGTASANTSNLREFYTVTGLTGTDFEGLCVIDPQNMGLDIGAGALLASQCGVALRYQNDATNHTAVTINNNIIFGTFHVNAGVWRATVAGASFTNRQAAFPSFSNYPLPYGFYFKLVGSIITVTQFNYSGGKGRESGLAADTISGDLSIAGFAGTAPEITATPTPTGSGGAGFISAHLGTDSRSMNKIRPFSIIRALD